MNKMFGREVAKWELPPHLQILSKKVVWTANQPLYFPAMYMMDRFAKCEQVVIMSEAQFSKFGHQSRALIGTRQGHHTLVLPLQKKSFKPLNEIWVHEPERWLKDLKKTLQSVYGRATYFELESHSLFQLLDAYVETMAPVGLTQAALCSGLTMWACRALQLPCQFAYSLELVKERPEDANDWIIALGKAIGGTDYIGGEAAMKEYVSAEKWDAAEIKYWAQQYKMPEYKALWGTEADGNVCILDPLFLLGSEETREMVKYHAVSEA